MHDLFVNAALASPPRCMGRQLRPFSLAHAHVLLASGSPYLGDGDPALADLVYGVWVCSQEVYPFERIAAAVRDKRLVRKFARWGRRFDLRNLSRESQAFAQYVAVGLNTPPRVSSSKPGQKRREMRVPWTMGCVSSLIAHGVDEDRAWTMPMALAVSYRLTFDFLDGDDSLVVESKQQAVADALRTPLSELTRHG